MLSSPATPDKSQTYVPDTFKVTAGDGSTIYDSSAPSGYQGIFSYTAAAAGDPSRTGTLEYTFADSFSDIRTVTFQTKVADPAQYFGQSVLNTAGFGHDGINQTIAGSASVPTPNYIKKAGNYNSVTKQIDWTVTFNNDSLPLHGVKITDPLPGGLTLATSPNPVKVNGAPVDKDTNTDPGVGKYTYDSGTHTLVYNAGDITTPTTPQTLTFSTDLPADYWQGNHNSDEFSNTATMTATDNSYLQSGAPGAAPGVGAGNSVVSKTSPGYDKETHRISWQIVVNASGQDLPDASITDVIPAGQKYLPDTFEISAGAPNNGSTGLQKPTASYPSDPSTGSTTLTYAFGPISSSDKYTITYQTEVTDPAVWAGNVDATNNYSNTVTLNLGSGLPPSSATGSQTVSPTVLTKAVAGYDYTTHEITWKIVVNQDQLPLTGAVVTDVLTGNGMDEFTLETDNGTIKVNDASISADGSAAPAVNTYSYDESSKTLTFHLGDLNSATAADRTKTITFKTKLNKTGPAYDSYFGANGDHKITNSATLTTTENPTPVNASATEPIHNTLVGKTGYYKTGKAYIDWVVEIDQNGIELNNLTLTDTLQQGLSLDTSTVQLYAQALQADGSYTPSPSYADGTGTLSVPGGTAEPLTKDNISYDARTRTFVFTIPGTINGPYLLTFRTMVDAAYSGTTFTNSISFNGGSTGQQDVSGGTPVGFSAADGTAWGETGNVTVRKEDGATHAGLAAAVFGLYDQYENLMLISGPTGGAGTVSFDHLLFGVPYTVREITPPANYEASADSYSFKLDQSGKVQLLDSAGNPTGGLLAGLPALRDSRKAGTVSFIKQGDGGAPLTGATFTLCDAGGNPVNGFSPVTTGGDGAVTFSNVPYGSYQIKETSAPTGYLPLTAPFTLDDSNHAIATSGTTHTLDLGTKTDQPCGSITVTKSGADYAGGPTVSLPGAVFAVLDGTGAQVGLTRQTDSSGQAAFRDLPVGSYTLHEVSAPAGYQTVPDHPFTISAGDSAAQRQLTYAVTNIKKSGSISFTKTDGTSPLPGAVFTLYDSAGSNPVRNGGGVIAAMSVAGGLVQFTDVPYGDYIIKETAAPHNFAAMSPIPVSLQESNNGIVALGTVSDSLRTGTIRFTKTDGVHALPGAQFKLTGNGITLTATSDANGLVQFLNVPYSDSPYTVSETQAPAPYYQKAADLRITLKDETVDAGGNIVFANPVVDVPLGSIAVTKKDAGGTTPLAGATFALYDSGNHLVRTASPTGSDGRVFFGDLPLNPAGATVYTLREVAAPANYGLAADRAVTLYNEDGRRDAAGLVVTDTWKTGTIELTKVDQDGKGLAGATFTLCDALTGDPVQFGGQPVTAVSDSHGQVIFSHIPFGSYVIKETSAPADYTRSDQVIAADLTDSNLHVFLDTLVLTTPVTDAIKTAGIRFTKLGGDGKLPGATFTLYDSAGKNPVVIGGSPATATSDADGLVVFANIPYGDYTLVETAPPADYMPTPPVSVALHDSNSALVNGMLTLGSISDALMLGSITLTKLDENGGGLAGATFVLKDAGGNPVGSPQTSGRDGRVTFAGVPYGDGYSLTETQAPADYGTLSAPITGIGLHASATILQSVYDSRLTGSISFTKVDAGGKPLAGAEFMLYDAGGNPVGRPQVSDKNGRVIFTGVPFKDGYTVRETQAPENYAGHAAFTVNLHADSYDCGKVVDDLLRGGIQVTKTDPDGHPLAGTTFTLYDTGGKAVGQAVSSAKGVAAFTEIPYGDYIIRETAAPEGYGIDRGAHAVSLNAQNPAPVLTVIDTKVPVASPPQTGIAGNNDSGSAGSAGGPAAGSGQGRFTSLPQTGDDGSPLLAVVGVLALISGCVVLVRKYHSGNAE